MWRHGCDSLRSALITATGRGSWWLQSHSLPHQAQALALATPPAARLDFVIKGERLAFYFRESATSSLIAQSSAPGSPGTMAEACVAGSPAQLTSLAGHLVFLLTCKLPPGVCLACFVYVPLPKIMFQLKRERSTSLAVWLA